MMRGLLIVLSIFCVLVAAKPAGALTTDVLITHAQLGGSGTGTTTQEFVAISNSSDVDIDISGWCIRYADYLFTTISDLYCFDVAASADEVHISAKASAVVVSHTYPLAVNTSVTGLFKFASTSISGARGHIVLSNAQNEAIDTLAWDNKGSLPPTKPETLAASAPAGGSMLQRSSQSSSYIDTNNNSVDFMVRPSILPTALPLIDYEEPEEIVDICGTIDGIQETVPESYDFDEAGNCELKTLDQCSNIDHVQITIPENLLQDNAKQCYDALFDVCTNILGLQLDIPTGYRSLGNNLCKQITAKATLTISEILPNVSGIDTGREFIELFNPNFTQVDISDYYLKVGKDLEKQVSLPEMTILPGSYAVFYDAELGFTFLNTTTKIQLVYYDGSVINEIIPYEDPAEDMTWAYIDNVWQYTNNSTPGHENKTATEILGEQNEDKQVAACPAGKYRNPLTNRCRNIEEDVSVLGSCDADEYRNPETNRCRKIATVINSLTPCEIGYERNEETNRCRKITQESSLGPCAEGYERNPETNRCRKLLSDEVLASAVEEVADSQQNMSVYPLIATATAGGIAFGLYEWRVEARSIIRRVFDYFPKK